MNAILGYTRLLRRSANDRLTDREQRNLNNIETSSENQLKLINELLDLARIEAGRVELQPQPVDLCQLAAECAEALESLVQEGVELRRTLANVAPLTTDPDCLRQVLMNLLSNAVKFTTLGRITLSVQPAGDCVELTVTDTGIGIPEEDLPFIFEEFRQVDRDGAEAQGSGLGLAIVKKSVELLGGTIQVESELDKGTRFTIRVSDYNKPF